MSCFDNIDIIAEKFLFGQNSYFKDPGFQILPFIHRSKYATHQFGSSIVLDPYLWTDSQAVDNETPCKRPKCVWQQFRYNVITWRYSNKTIYKIRSQYK